MNKDLKTFNELWGIMGMRPLTQEEYDKELENNPNLWKDYQAQQEVAKKYDK